MMNKINFITTKIPTALINLSGLGKYCFSFNIQSLDDLKNISLTALHKKEIYTATNLGFSFYFNLRDDSSIKVLRDHVVNNIGFIIQLFFHPQFEKTNDIPTIFADSRLSQKPQFNSLVNLLQSNCLKQGFNGIRVVYTDRLTTSVADVLHEFLSLSLFKQSYKDAVSKDFYVARYFSLLNVDNELFDSILQEKKDAEQELRTSNKELYTHLKRYVEYCEEIPRLKKELYVLKEDLNNQGRHMKIIMNQDEALKINKFYHYEYEILPLWYKRFGHILKVFMGKRSFRSLYDNNVKKYKN